MLTGVHNETSMVLLSCKLTRPLLVGTPPSGPVLSIPEASPHCCSCCSVGLQGRAWKLPLWPAHKQLKVQETHKANLQPSSLGNQIAALNLYGCPCLFSSLPHGLCLKEAQVSQHENPSITRTQTCSSFTQPLTHSAYSSRISVHIILMSP